MANASAILDKIVRNMEQRGYANPAKVQLVGTTVQFTKVDTTVLLVTYVNKNTQSPMGGVDPTVSPYLGIGIAAPGSLKIKGAAGQNTVAAIFNDSGALELMVELAGYANDLIVEAGDTTTQLARIRGDESVLGMGS